MKTFFPCANNSVMLQGIDPKLEFSSNSTIHETTVPGTYAELTSVGNGDESASDSEVRKEDFNYLSLQSN